MFNSFPDFLAGVIVSSFVCPYLFRLFDKVIVGWALRGRRAWKKKSARKSMEKLQRQLDEARKYHDNPMAFIQAALSTILVAIPLTLVDRLFSLYSKFFNLPILTALANFFVTALIASAVVLICMRMVDIYVRVKNFEEYRLGCEKMIEELRSALAAEEETN